MDTISNLENLESLSLNFAGCSKIKSFSLDLSRCQMLSDVSINLSWLSDLTDCGVEKLQGSLSRIAGLVRVNLDFRCCESLRNLNFDFTSSLTSLAVLEINLMRIEVSKYTIQGLFKMVSNLLKLKRLSICLDGCVNVKSAGVDLTKSASYLQELNLSFLRCVKLRYRGMTKLCRTLRLLNASSRVTLNLSECPLTLPTKRRLMVIFKKREEWSIMTQS
eukprot:TRINITY_DN16218_c0_g1_i1.p1 TRINITY_DN16218_c0_g1~~TRINITY_DN16218_c0_g1_i1.p1  ORF type:complete len:219 (-),score=-8.73 TRINITY_DN16218_c0_g1_i1:36-692(-)